MRVLNFLLVAIFSLMGISAHASDVKCDLKLKPYLAAIEKVPSGRKLLDAIQAEGMVQIKAEENGVTEQFRACWAPDCRTIFIGMGVKPQPHEIFESLIFELHNASTNSHYDYVDALAVSKKIGKEDYVRWCEYIEYQNSIKAAAIVKQGIAMKIFPKNVYLHVYKDFEEYLYYQKMSGHSAVFARNYDLLVM